MVAFDEGGHIFGGFNLKARLSTVEIFVTKTEQFTSIKPMPDLRCSFGEAISEYKLYSFDSVKHNQVGTIQFSGFVRSLQERMAKRGKRTGIRF